jgi:hypothetical protein
LGKSATLYSASAAVLETFVCIVFLTTRDRAADLLEIFGCIVLRTTICSDCNDISCSVFVTTANSLFRTPICL